MATMTVSSVHEFALVATARTLRQALGETKSRSAPADLALQALSCAFDCDTPGAITLLRRALNHRTVSTEDRPYIRELLLMYLVNSGDYDAFEDVLAEGSARPSRVKHVLIAYEAVLHAVRGRPTRSRELSRRAMQLARNVDAPLLLGRVVARCSIAAYYRRDFDEAMELALESAHICEVHGGYNIAAGSYSVAGAIAGDWRRDAAMTAGFYERMLTNAERAEHEAMLRSALVGSFIPAAERFDVQTCRSLRGRLRARPAAEQNQENFSFLVAETLFFGWNADFGAAENEITAGAGAARSHHQRALLEALRSLVDTARWDVDEARRRSRMALQLTADLVEQEPIFEFRFRETARILAAATCFIIGDHVRGERALSARFDPGHRFLSLLTARSIDTAAFPEVFRGYAEFIRVASESAQAARPRNGLTPAELQVLRALPTGATLGEIARDFAKSKNTVARQVESIYEKLSARNRAHVVENARQLGILT